MALGNCWEKLRTSCQKSPLEKEPEVWLFGEPAFVLGVGAADKPHGRVSEALPYSHELTDPAV